MRGAPLRRSCVKDAAHWRQSLSASHPLLRLGSYDELVKAIIRPPRAEYEIEELGPAHFEFAGVAFERDDIELRNSRGLALHCSLWRRRVSPEGGTPCAAPPEPLPRAPPTRA